MCRFTLCVVGLLFAVLHILSVDTGLASGCKFKPYKTGKPSLSRWSMLTDGSDPGMPVHRVAALLNRYCNVVGHHSESGRLPIYFGLCSGLITKFKKKSFSKNQLTLTYLCFILILLAFDTETNPGPTGEKQDNCGICDQAVKWYPDRGIFCEDCNTWFHARCQGVSSTLYQFYSDHSNEPWQCTNCGIPHFTSSFFDHSKDELLNQTSLSLNSTISSLHSPLQNDKPLKSSTPINKQKQTRKLHSIQNLKIITVNCQSVRKKNLGFLSMLETVKPDIVLGNESWLKPNIKSSEVFPADYEVYRKDRKGRTGGGVFILVSKSLKSYALPELKSNSEIIWAKIKQNGKKDLLVCSVDRPDQDVICIDKLEHTIDLTDQDNSLTVIGGDLSLGDINWETKTVKPHASRPDICSKLLELTDNYCMTQVINE